MNDQQKLVELFDKGFSDPWARKIALTGIWQFFPQALGEERQIPNIIRVDWPDGNQADISRDDFENAFLESLSRNPQTEGFIIDSSTYNYLLGLDQTPTPEFTETTSTTPDKIRLEELEEFAKKTKEKGGLAEAMAEQKAKIKAWEKKVASSPAPSVSSPRRRGSSELEPETEKESAEVFVVQTQPKIITLTQPDQEQLQAVKNAFEKGGEANFRKEVEEKVRTEIETRLTPSKEADFLVSVTVDTLTKTIKNLPPEIQREIKIIDPPLAPLTALTDSQKTAQMEGVKKIINEAVLATNQVTEVLE